MRARGSVPCHPIRIPPLACAQDESKYCPNYGDRSCEDGEVLKLMETRGTSSLGVILLLTHPFLLWQVLKLMEANDNHEETHTVADSTLMVRGVGPLG